MNKPQTLFQKCSYTNYGNNAHTCFQHWQLNKIFIFCKLVIVYITFTITNHYICFIEGFARNHIYGTYTCSHSLSNDVDHDVKAIVLLNDTPNPHLYQIQPFLLVVSGHPSNNIRPDTQVRAYEGKHVDFVSNKIQCDDLEVCCFAFAVCPIDLQ